MSGGTYMGQGKEDGPMQIDDETLMALADGELDPVRARALRQAVAADPALQARLHRFEETRRLLGGLRSAGDTKLGDTKAGDAKTDDPGAEDPLAAMIRAAVRPDGAAVPPVATVAPVRLGAAGPRPGTPANLSRGPWRAAAASAAIVALGLGWWNWAGAPVAPGLSAAELAALDALPSGQVQPLEGGGELAMIASFRASDGGLCREYETAGATGRRVVLACRGQGGWAERFAAVAQDGGQDYRPASGTATIDAAIAGIGAGAPLTPEDEAAALRE